MGINEILEGEESTLSRRTFLQGAAAAGTAAVAGCAGDDRGTEEESPTDTTQDQTTDDTPTDTAETTQDEDTATEEQPQEEEMLQDIQETRANLTESQKRAEYQSGIPSVNDYDLDFDRVQSENDTRREQLVDVVATVGDQYEDWVEGNHALMNAVHNLDWMGWDQDNLVNIVTRYNSSPIEEITANYSTEDGGRNLDGMNARDSVSGEETFRPDLPDSELMDGDQNNNLVTDIETWANSIAENNWGPENYEALRLNMLSVIPGVNGKSVHSDRDARDIGLVLDDEAIQYIGECYNESADLANEVSKEGLEIEMSTEDVRNSGRYVGVTSGEDGLEVDTIYSQEEGREKMREPVEL